VNGGEKGRPPYNADTLRTEMRIAAGDLGNIGSIMLHLGRNVPSDEIQPGWFEFFGRAVEGVSTALEAVAGDRL
jgi:hypothetical protein